MKILDFTRAAEFNLKILDDMVFDAVLDFSRSDSVSVDFTGKLIKFDVYDKRGGTLLDSISSDSEITILTSQLTFNQTWTNLSLRAYYFILYNDDDDIGIGRGKLIIE